MKHKIIIIVAVIGLVLSSAASLLAAQKTLYLEEQDGSLYYDSSDPTNPTAFIISPEMELGNVYSESIEIENKAIDTYALFFQLNVPNGQDASAAQLLSMIQMRIYLDGIKMFEGSGDGLIKEPGSIDINALIGLGDYKNKDKKTLKVEYELNENAMLSYESGYYVLSQYEAWEQGGFLMEDKPLVYQSQEAAANAATLVNEGDIKYVESARLFSQQFSKLKTLTARSQWMFYAHKETNVGDDNPPLPSPIKPAPDTGDNTSSIYLIVALGALSIILFEVLRSRRRKCEKSN